jgi:hypothetical protein
MIYVKDSYGSVYDVKVEEKRVKANYGTGDKQQDGTYKNSYWNVVFIGGAFEKAKTLTDKDRIHITKAKLTNELYTPKDSDKKRTWLQLTVFEFEKHGDDKSDDKPAEEKPKRTKGKAKAKTKAEEVVEEVIDDDDLPF